jgi:hypothetical protein
LLNSVFNPISPCIHKIATLAFSYAFLYYRRLYLLSLIERSSEAAERPGGKRSAPAKGLILTQTRHGAVPSTRAKSRPDLVARRQF